MQLTLIKGEGGLGTTPSVNIQGIVFFKICTQYNSEFSFSFVFKALERNNSFLEGSGN